MCKLIGISQRVQFEALDGSMMFQWMERISLNAMDIVTLLDLVFLVEQQLWNSNCLKLSEYYGAQVDLQNVDGQSDLMLGESCVSDKADK